MARLPAATGYPGCRTLARPPNAGALRTHRDVPEGVGRSGSSSWSADVAEQPQDDEDKDDQTDDSESKHCGSPGCEIGTRWIRNEHATPSMQPRIRKPPLSRRTAPN